MYKVSEGYWTKIKLIRRRVILYECGLFAGVHRDLWRGVNVPHMKLNRWTIILTTSLRDLQLSFLFTNLERVLFPYLCLNASNRDLSLFRSLKIAYLLPCFPGTLRKLRRFLRRSSSSSFINWITDRISAGGIFRRIIFSGTTGRDFPREMRRVPRARQTVSRPHE